MAWSLLCLLLLTVCSGPFSQPVLTQSPDMSVSLGATAKLTCTLSSQHSTYNIAWYQQSPGKAPRYIMHVTSSGGVSKGDGIPDRFSGSSSGANRYLSISNVQPEDEADYYCQTYTSGSGYAQHSVLTTITHLGVTLLEQSSPSSATVSRLPPSAQMGQPGGSCRLPSEKQRRQQDIHECLFLGSFSQPLLTQSPDMTVSLGATARLTCTPSSQHCGYDVGWHQQSPGKAPRFMYVTRSGGVRKG
ncbi:uncharacterized protein LOC141499641 [Macrotis lagotis]|uniref:uncharacterized protein LOC141499641 n=1 Tax=Macrotis lagotis TaxID=92651 RepID=UPI003D68C596